MTRDEPTPLLEEFPVPGVDGWDARARRELRGRGPEVLNWRTADGIESPPLFTRRDLADLPHLAPGILDAVMPRTPWAIRQRIDCADPDLAGTLCAEAVGGGADELLLRFDRLVMRGADPGTLAEAELEWDLDDGESGLDGCPIYHADGLDAVLRGVDLAATPIALEPGSSALAVLGAIAQVAQRRRIPPGSLRVELGLDPLRELATGPALAASATDLLAECATAVRATADLPSVVPLAVHSSPYHHAGATPSQELGCTIATAVAYLRELARAGVPAGAAAPLVLRIAIDTDILVEIAKLRAARLLFAKVARGFGRSDPRIAVHAESSARSWSGDDVHTNLLRSNVHAFAASLAACDSISPAPFERSDTGRDRDACRIARNELLLLREESLLQAVSDPCRGAFAVEALTDRIARAAWEQVQEIESRGGMLAALQSGYVQERIADAAEHRRYALATGEATLVGTSRFVDPQLRRAATSARNPDAIQHRMFGYLAARAPAASDVAADDLPSLTAAAAAGCTFGEVTRAIRGAQPVELRRTFHEATPDGAPFEMLRELARDTGIAVQPVVAGDPAAARPALALARDFCTTFGMDWLEPVTALAAVPAQARILVLCGDDEAVAALLPGLAAGRILAVAGPRRPELESRVDAHLYPGCDAPRIARELFLLATGDAEVEVGGEDGP